MNAILSGEFRDRAKVAIARIHSEQEAQEQAERDKKIAMQELAIKEFKLKFQEACPSLASSLSLRFAYNAKAAISGSWVIQTPGQYYNCSSGFVVRVRLELVGGAFLEVYCHSSSSNKWRIIFPELNSFKVSWVARESGNYIDKASLEEVILIALYDYEQILPEYYQALKDVDQRQLNRQKQRELEQERLKENEIIQNLLSQQKFFSYSPEDEWGDSQVIVYKVRYCCGVVTMEDGIDFDYEEVYSLNYPQEDNGKVNIALVEGDRLFLDKGEHKPVVNELTLDSYPSAKEKLGRVGFIKGGYKITIVGAMRYPVEDALGGCDYYWRFDDEGSEEIVLDHWQMRPWLREALGLQPLVKKVVNIAK